MNMSCEHEKRKKMLGLPEKQYFVSKNHEKKKNLRFLGLSSSRHYYLCPESKSKTTHL
jgi:hypothetical protein